MCSKLKFPLLGEISIKSTFIDFITNHVDKTGDLRVNLFI